MTGDIPQFCSICDQPIPIGSIHLCYGHRSTYQRQPAPDGGCQPFKQLTEERVRQIVREELAKAKP